MAVRRAVQSVTGGDDFTMRQIDTWLRESARPGQPPVPVLASLGGLFLRTPSAVTVYGFMPVMFMCLGSVFWMVVTSLLTRVPSAATIQKFFPPSKPQSTPLS